MIIVRSHQPDDELEQRILQILRRENIQAEQICLSSRANLCFDSLVIDGHSRQVYAEGCELALTKTEFSLLLFLAQNPGTALSKEELLCAVWGSQSEDTTKVVANSISNLRKKLGIRYKSFIKTTAGGYAFVPEASVQITARE